MSQVLPVSTCRYGQAIFAESKDVFFSPPLQIKDCQIANPTSAYTHLAVRQLEAACLDYSLLFYVRQ